MTFATPLALLLLLTLPYFVWVGWPRLPFRRRDLLSLVLRLMIVFLLVMGLAGAQLVLAADTLATIFLVDFSDSMGAIRRQAAIDYVEAALGSMRPDDQAGLILFGADALVERSLSPGRRLAEIYSTPLTLDTNIAQAIRLALALYPPGMARRMVILSDGLATRGDAEAAARLAAASDVQIDFVTFERPSEPEVLITEVNTPARLDEGQFFDLSLTLESNVYGPATVTVMASGQVVHQQRVALQAGTQRFVLSLKAGAPGFTGFRVMVEPDGADTFYQNNVLSSFSRITGAPRVLLVRKDPRSSAELVRALEATGIIVDEVAPSALPVGLASLGPYKSVVLVNVPAASLSPRRMAVLQVYVRDLGGGLVVVGGDASYGVGGYYGTMLEETLPVGMQIHDRERLPRLALVFAIDRSGSMAQRERVGGYTHLDIAKEAILRSVELLGPMDAVGVLGFDSSAFWVVDLQRLDDRAAVNQSIGTLIPGGGTSIFAAVDAIAAVLPAYDSDVKHLVLLSDGAANPQGVYETVMGMYEEAGVTTSVVIIGENALTWPRRLAEATGGRFHWAPDVSAIPAIFTAETVLAARSYLVEEEFYPTLGTPSTLLSGIIDVPPLQGYVVTEAKPSAQTILLSHEGDPLLAVWQYGLGRAVAWTSDASPKWAPAWVAWENFARFWGQVVRWTITEGADDNIEVLVAAHDGTARVSVDAMDRDARYLNGLDLVARVVDPDLDVVDVALQQVAPGRYEGEFAPAVEGAYFVGVAGSGAAGAVMQTTGWVLSYSPEYRALEDDSGLLERIAALTGGRALERPGDAFEHNLTARRAPTVLWRWLFLAALLLLPVDIAVRRLVLTRRDLERLRVALAELFGGEPARDEVRAEQAARLSQLKRAKERAARSTRRGDGEPAVRTDEAVRPRSAAEPPARPAAGGEQKTIEALLQRHRRARRTDDRDEE